MHLMLLGAWVGIADATAHTLVIATREHRSAWSVHTITHIPDLNGDVTYELHVAPGPSGAAPTFVLLERWDRRACCDEEGMPDWTSGPNVLLAWRGTDRAWRSAALSTDHADMHAPSVRVAANGNIVLDRARMRVPSRRLADLRGAQPRDAWLAR